MKLPSVGAVADIIEREASPCDGGSCDTDRDGRCLAAVAAAEAVLREIRRVARL